MSIKLDAVSDSIRRLLRSRTPGKLSDPVPFDVTLTKRPANKEDILMTKDEKSEETVFDFTNVGDPVKNALALSYEAVREHMDVLPDEVVEFYKSADKELDFGVAISKAAEDSKDKKDGDKDEDEEDDDKKKEKKEDGVDRVVEAVKSALPTVVTEIQKEANKPLEVEIKKNREEIAALTGRLEQDEMRGIAETLMPNGDKPSDEKVAELTIIRKSMDDKQWESYLESRRSDRVLIEKAALFERQSNPSATTPASAHAELKSIADSIIEKSEVKDVNAAMEAAIHQNPALYKRYQKEQAAQAEGVEA